MKFIDKVLRIVKRIPKGRVTTYKEIARILNSSPRAVGQALKRNKELIIIPCHRVINSDWSIGGYVLGKDMKKRLLESEGVNINKLKDYFIKL